MARILVIEDDPDINGILVSLLTGAGYDVMRAFSGREAIPFIKSDPDLILMDLMLPDTTGEALLTQVAEGIPVIAVSARSQVTDKVDLLTRGCVDYVTKPFDNKELLARIEVALRFKKKDNKTLIGNITLDDNEHEIRVGDDPVRLTPTEYAIMKVLILNSDRVISRSELMEEAQKDTPDLVEESLKVHMSNLRRKIKTAGSDVEIEAVWGIGFRLTVS
ncbi:MAG: response regulator transcription factor [Clostridiales bacterium]|nr:response regulator transcription factor [Clostridiales bacterium]